jgi:AcrR family transcriptional regulator
MARTQTNSPARSEAADARGRTTAIGDATRTRLMQAAERLIAEQGLDGVSVRDITAAAETNSASIHYHFQSKEGLIYAIMEDRAERLRALRHRHLGKLDDRRPTTRQVAEALVNPTFAFVTGEGAEADTAYVGFLAAVLDDPTMMPALERYFSDQYESYFEALRRARPDLAQEVLVNRVCFALHLVLNTVSEPARGLRTWIERHYPPAIVVIRESLIDFVAGAFEAP